jgi:hypothetical protein
MIGSAFQANRMPASHASGEPPGFPRNAGCRQSPAGFLLPFSGRNLSIRLLPACFLQQRDQPLELVGPNQITQEPGSFSVGGLNPVDQGERLSGAPPFQHPGKFLDPIRGQFGQLGRG